MTDKGCSPECAWGGFLQHGLPGNRFDLIDDIEFPPHTVELLTVHGRAFRAVATKRPGRHVHAVQPRHVNDRNFNLTRLGEEFLNVGRAFHPASPQLPGQVLIASTTGSGLSPNTHRYRSISNSAGRSPKPMGRGGLLTNVALSCSVRNFSQTRSAMSYLPK